MEDFQSGDIPDGNGATSRGAKSHETDGEAFFDSWQKFMGRSAAGQAEAAPEQLPTDQTTPVNSPDRPEMPAAEIAADIPAAEVPGADHTPPESVLPFPSSEFPKAQDQGVLRIRHDDETEPHQTYVRPEDPIQYPSSESLTSADFYNGPEHGAEVPLEQPATAPGTAGAGQGDQVRQMSENPMMRPEETLSEPPPIDQMLQAPFDEPEAGQKFQDSVYAAENDIPLEGDLEKSHEIKGDPSYLSADPTAATAVQETTGNQWEGRPNRRMPLGQTDIVPPIRQNGMYSKSQGSRLQEELYRKALVYGFGAGLVIVTIMLIIANIR